MPEHMSEAKKSLALLRLDRIGDFLLWLPTAKYYRERYRDYHITLIGNALWRDIAQHLIFWDEFIPVTGEPNWRTDILTERHFDLLINLQYSRTFSGDLFAHALPAQEKIGVNIKGPNISDKDFLTANEFYTGLIFPASVAKHELERNFEILSLVTGTETTATLDGTEGLSFCKPLQLPNIGRYAAFFPGTSWKKRALPWPRFVEIADYVSQQYNLAIVLCGNTEDMIACNNIAKNSKAKEIVNQCGRLSLAESLDIIKSADFVIANDSMAAHAAILLDKRSVCILGGGYNSPATGEGRFFPYPQGVLLGRNKQITVSHPMACYGCNNHCIYNDLAQDCIPCVEYIDTDQVKEAIDRCLFGGRTGILGTHNRHPPEDRVALAYNTMDRKETTLATLRGLDADESIDLFWCDGSRTPEGRSVPSGQYFSRARLKEIHYDVTGGADAAIRYSLRRMLDLGYTYFGLVENDIQLDSGWFDALKAAMTAAQHDGLRIGAVTARTFRSRTLLDRNQYAILWNIGAGMILFSREGAEAVLADYHETDSLEVEGFWKRAGFKLDAWELRMDKPLRSLGADWWYGAVMAKQGLASIGCIPSLARNIDHDPESDFRTSYVHSSTAAEPGQNEKFAAYKDWLLQNKKKVRR